MTSGCLIAAMGIPGCGKSSVFRCLAKTLDVPVMHEPEESEWTDAVHERDVCGRVTAVTWFRAMRVPLLYRAAEVRDAGGTVLVDSYYDKLVSHYLAKPGMEWLVEPNDPYYPAIQQLADLDWKLLPNADCVVVFELSISDWKQMLQKRGRRLDAHDGFLQSYPTQQYFLDASRAYADETGARVVRLSARFCSPEEMAHVLHEQLCAEGVIS